MITSGILFIRSIATYWFFSPFCRSQSCAVMSVLPWDIYSHQTAYDAISHSTYLFGGLFDPSTPASAIYKRNMNQTDWIALTVSTPETYFYSYAKNSIIINRIVYFIGIESSSNGDSFQAANIDIFNIDTEEWMPNNDNQLTSPP
eukprot:229900_1